MPSDFVEKFYAHANETFQAWEKARPANDFESVRPLLEKTLDLSRRYAEYFAPYDHIMDPLIDESDYGMSVATIRPLFEQLRGQLVPLVEAVTAAEPVDDSCLKQTFPEAQQWQFGLEVAQGSATISSMAGWTGRLTPSRRSSRWETCGSRRACENNDLGDALFSTVHECGHAMYEQGINPAYEATPLGSGTSSGVHESQSRLWENLVGRSIDFWHYYYPRLQQVFPQQLGAVPLETFHRAINKVQRSLIRTDADELTYNLHVMIRFGLEAEMLEGRLAIKDLPDAWNAAYKRDLGIEPPDDRDGCLQDVHWYGFRVGGVFQGYTLGNIMSAYVLRAPRLRRIPTFLHRCARGGSTHCLAGYARTSTNTGRSSPRRSWCGA